MSTFRASDTAFLHPVFSTCGGGTPGWGSTTRLSLKSLGQSQGDRRGNILNSTFMMSMTAGVSTPETELTGKKSPVSSLMPLGGAVEWLWWHSLPAVPSLGFGGLPWSFLFKDEWPWMALLAPPAAPACMEMASGGRWLVVKRCWRFPRCLGALRQHAFLGTWFGCLHSGSC